MEKNESNKKLLYCIAVLIVLTIGLSSYIVYDKILKVYQINIEEKDKNRTCTSDEINKTNESAVAKMLFDSYINLFDDFAFSNILDFENQNSINFKNLPTEKKFKIVQNQLDSMNKISTLVLTDELGYNYVEISKEDLTDVYRRLFGDEELDYVDNFIGFNYNFNKDDNGNYRGRLTEVGGAEGFIGSYLCDYKNSNDDFILIVKSIFAYEAEDILYKDEDLTTKICSLDDAGEHYDEMSTYKYIFKAQGGRYIFDKVEKLS